MTKISDLKHHTAGMMLELQRLFEAVIDSLANGPELRATIAQRGSRVIIDEATGLIAFSTFTENREPIWIEAIRCDPNDADTFGRTSAQLAGPSSGSTH
jgi:hypothetical protein